MDQKQAIGARLRQLRRQHQVTQKYMSDLLGVATSSVCGYESGDVAVSVEALATIAQHFRVSLDWLIMGTDKNTPLTKILAEDELQLLYCYRSMPKDARDKARMIMEMLAKEKNNKEDKP